MPLEIKSSEMQLTVTNVMNAQLVIDQMLLREDVRELSQPALALRSIQKMDSDAKNVQTTCLPLTETLDASKLHALIQIKFLESHRTAINAEFAKQELFQIL